MASRKSSPFPRVRVRWGYAWATCRRVRRDFLASACAAHAVRVAGNRVRGFTLVEVMVAAALAGFVLWGVLLTNLQLMRSGVRIAQYAEMETQVRRGLEQLGRDLRVATAIRWNSPSDLTLTLPTGSGGTLQVTYACTAAEGIFFLVPGASSALTAGRTNLVRGIPAAADGRPGVTFARFDRDGNAATADAATKRVQVSVEVRREARTMAATTANSVTATFTLRNKPIL